MPVLAWPGGGSQVGENQAYPGHDSVLISTTSTTTAAAAAADPTSAPAAPSPATAFPPPRIAPCPAFELFVFDFSFFY